MHPAILAAVERANAGHALAYGRDMATARTQEVLRGHFGRDAECLLVFGGTGANVVALGSVCDRFSSIVCANSSHLWNDERGAPEQVIGCKLVPLPHEHGKLTCERVAATLAAEPSVHASAPAVVSIAQPTEWGTLYTPREIAQLAELAHAHGAALHVDGARLANACAALGVGLRELSTDAGVDVVSLGGTKNGMLYGDAVVLLAPGLGLRAQFARKQGMQLASKMRFIAAQFEAAFAGDLWLSLAGHANAMARRLANALTGVVTEVEPVQTNAMFARLPTAAIERAQVNHDFYRWGELPDTVRWMTSWDTSEAEVDAFAADIRAAV